MRPQQQPGPGFADPVHDAQAAFRQVLAALSRPGRQVAVGQPVPGLQLGGAMAHLLLALTDEDTAVWWQEENAATSQWLRFHTGAAAEKTSRAAQFAVVVKPETMPPLAAFAPGSAESPEASATVFVEVPSLDGGPRIEWHGPGIQGSETVRINGLAPGFWAQWQSSQAEFPQGVDLVFTCANAAIGLPRSTRVRRLEGI